MFNLRKILLLPLCVMTVYALSLMPSEGRTIWTAAKIGWALWLLWGAVLFVRRAPRAVSLTIAAALALVVVGYRLAYPSYEIRYRVTLTIEANGVEITESAVWEDRWGSGPGWVMMRSGTSWASAMFGDSLVFDLPDGRQFLVRVTLSSGPRTAFGPEPSHMSLRDILARLEALPVGSRGTLPVREFDDGPILLPSRESPAGLRRVRIFEPNDTGIRYVSGSMEITDLPITRHIEGRVTWFSEWSLTAHEWDRSSTTLAKRELRK